MNNLIKILKLVNKIETWEYSLQWKIYDEVVKDISCVSEFIDKNDYRYHQLTKESLLNEKNWTTYSDCVKMTFYIKNNNIYVNMEHYTHGKSFDYGCGLGYYGFDKVLEWEATIKLPVEFIKNITDNLNYKFNNFCQNAYEEYLEGERLKWIDEFKKSILCDNDT